MPTYIMLTTLTSEGAHTVHANPDRLTALADEVANFGCKVVAEYAVLGQYDFVTIVECADNETVAHLSVDLGSRGDGPDPDPAGDLARRVYVEAEGPRPARPLVGALGAPPTRLLGPFSRRRLSRSPSGARRRWRQPGEDVRVDGQLEVVDARVVREAEVVAAHPGPDRAPRRSSGPPG